MAPITDTVVDELKSLVNKLETRVAELEAKLHGNQSSSPSTTEQMRMILMGPPGAGMAYLAIEASPQLQYRFINMEIHRQGHTSATD